MKIVDSDHVFQLNVMYSVSYLMTFCTFHCIHPRCNAQIVFENPVRMRTFLHLLACVVVLHCALSVPVDTKKEDKSLVTGRASMLGR